MMSYKCKYSDFQCLLQLPEKQNKKKKKESPQKHTKQTQITITKFKQGLEKCSLT